METITRAEMLKIFLSSTPHSPISIVYMHYSPARQLSQGPVHVARCHGIPMGAKSKGKYLSYIDLDAKEKKPVVLYEATIMYLNGKKVIYRNLTLPYEK